MYPAVLKTSAIRSKGTCVSDAKDKHAKQAAKFVNHAKAVN